MPTLNWIGKEAVVDHHRQVATRLLECDSQLSVGDADAENLLVEGDNLERLNIAEADRLELVCNFGRQFQRVAGRCDSVKVAATNKTL